MTALSAHCKLLSGTYGVRKENTSIRNPDLTLSSASGTFDPVIFVRWSAVSGLVPVPEIGYLVDSTAPGTLRGKNVGREGYAVVRRIYGLRMVMIFIYAVVVTAPVIQCFSDAIASGRAIPVAEVLA